MYTSRISRRLSWILYRLKIQGFAFKFFTVLLIFSKFSSIMIGFLSFISYPLVIVLHLESFESNLFKLGFSISKKMFFYGQTLLERCFFAQLCCGYFFKILPPFPYIKTLSASIRPCFQKKSDLSQQPLN